VRAEEARGLGANELHVPATLPAPAREKNTTFIYFKTYSKVLNKTREILPYFEQEVSLEQDETDISLSGCEQY
jgi:hypothetical protein